MQGDAVAVAGPSVVVAPVAVDGFGSADRMPIINATEGERRSRLLRRRVIRLVPAYEGNLRLQSQCYTSLGHTTHGAMPEAWVG